ncbi:CHAT domain-containing protein [Pantanalinema rosaneae CENA516]|uniref:CHAT domain-containing protein n=1 Tax=Pantanalinema rosaneae TaxID=1620701 RepID=UPI003D6E1245
MHKILVLAANPTDMNRLRLDEEVREIQLSLEQSRNRDWFEVITRWAVRVDDLQKVLLDYTPQIIHFSGHGTGSQGLVLENDVGQSELISTTALSGLFRLVQNEVECVFLNACYSDVQAEAIHQHIDCVLGMNSAVGDKTAIHFARGFYQAIGSGKPYDQAFEWGCNAIDLKGIPESSIPVLKYRKRSQSFSSAQSTSLSTAAIQPASTPIPQNRSIAIGGNVMGSAVIAGDANATTIHYQQAALPSQSSVDIHAEFNALRDVLAMLETPDRRKIDNAIADAEEELKKPQPDKDEVGQALGRALSYAQKAQGFAESMDKLRPHVEKAAGWLGENWYKLLPLVGLAI